MGNMSLGIKEEDCTICLEVITSASFIGTIRNCHHYYHEDCILQWSSHSNSCPTCRKLFYNIDISKYKERSKIRKLISIRDKLLTNDAIDQIPQEYIIPTNYPSTDRENHNTLDQIMEHYSSNNKLCSICSSSDYRSSLSRNLIYCNNCPSAFHLNCLGLNTYEESDDFVWCCPMCDNLQDLSSIPPYQSGLTSNRSRLSRVAGNIRPRANRIRTPRITTSVLNSHTVPIALKNSSTTTNFVPRLTNIANVTLEHASTENSRRRPGLIIHNENNELDDDFLYDTANHDDETHNRVDSRVYSPPIINGGVILRKELKEKQNLSKEEAQSWDVFEKARKCQNVTEIPDILASITPKIEEPRRRRRKKLSVLPQPDSELMEGTSTKLQDISLQHQEKTRISSLISQLRSSSQTGCKYEHTNMTIKHGNSPIPSTSTGALFGSTESISVDNEGLSDSENKYQRKKACLDKPTTMELSLEHKEEIQKHIRNNLRPLYRPGESRSSNSPTIKSEEIYIDINKSASRKIYAHILSLITSETGQLKSSILVDYFNEDETKLKSIVDKFVQDELRCYKW